jgi:hypothetical protein
MRHRRYTRECSEEREWKLRKRQCGAGTGINEEIWGRSERCLKKQQQRRTRVDAPQAERKGKWAVDQIFEGKPTGVTSPGMGTSVAHVIPSCQDGG